MSGAAGLSVRGRQPGGAWDTSGVFNVGQRAAVVGAFKLAGYEGPLLVAPVTSDDERIFLLQPEALAALREVRVLEQVLQQVLGRKVWIVEHGERWGAGVPFG